MNKYEVIFVIRPDASEETIAGAIDKAQEQITKNGGIILGLENWGTKKLAYEIDRITEGIYVKMDISTPGETIKKLNRHFALSEEVIRYQPIKLAEKKTAAS